MKRVLCLCFCLCLAFCFASEESHEDDQAADLQRDIQDYLRRLTHQQQRFTTQNMQSTFNGMLPYPQLNIPLPRLLPGQLRANDEGPLRFPYPNDPIGGGSRSFASSSILVKRPEDDGDVAVDAKAVAFSSVRDVNAEEHIGEGDEPYEKTASTDSEEGEKTPNLIPQTASASEALARKSGPSTLMRQQNTETIIKDDGAFSDVYFVAIVAGCCAAGIFGVVSAGFCFYRLQKSSKAAAEVDYPAYGVTGPSKDVSSPNGDRKLAQSAQMYHYQHQKQQMIAVEKAGSTKNTSASDVDSEEENEEGDYTVYECPGLAPTGEMEVKNPLFNDDSTPVSPPVLPAKAENNQNN